MTDTREPPGGAPAAAPTTDGGALRRADDIQLIGEMAGSGYRVPPSLVRRGDGQTVQLTPLLYALLESIDGERDVDGRRRGGLRADRPGGHGRQRRAAWSTASCARWGC